MPTDREWDIFMLEIEERNEGIIADFLLSKLRDRDLEAIAQLGEPPPEQIEDLSGTS